MDIVQKWCTRILTLNGGRIVADEPIVASEEPEDM
jgi:ABC-type phosphate/phosphonate transport system ATPase subunit